MFRPRVIPCLLLRGLGLVKSVRFKDHRYIGDPINAVRIFNAKQADELVFLDILASRERRTPPIDLVRKIGDECFMPFAVGGGIRNLSDIRELLNAGAEKVVINSHAVEDPLFVRGATKAFGSSTIVVSIDAKRMRLGRFDVTIYGATKATGLNPVEFAKQMEEMGAGEIIINSVDRDGTMNGYDIGLTRSVATAVSVPVVALGGAGKIQDLADAVNTGKASAAAAGSLFVYHGRRRAVLINFPTKQELLVLSS